MNAERRILLVEDDDGFRRTTFRSLGRRDKYRLTVTDSLAGARRALRENQFDLVIAGLVLSDGRGLELLPDIDRRLPLVVLASSGDEQAAVEAIKAGALDYVERSAATPLQIQHLADRALREWEHVVAQKQARRQLEQSEEKFRRIVETAQEGIWTLDPEGRISLANQTFADMLGCSIEELLGSVPGRWIDAGDEERFQRSLRPGSGDMGEAFELRFVQRGGQPVYTRVAVNRFDDDSGDHLGTLFMVTDISAQRRAESTLRDLESQLAQVSNISALGELMAELAHEVNQPLYAISNYAIGCGKTLERSAARDEKVLAWMREIVVQANRAGDIIRRLRDLTRKRESPRRREKLSDIVRKTMDFAAAQLRDRNVRLQLAIDAHQDVVVVDRIQIQQVLLNLLDNACDAMQCRNVERVVTMRLTSHSQEVEVSIEDNGVGLVEGDRERIFEAFFTSKPDAVGMGLAVSRTIIRSHGGQLWAADDLDDGARFHFRLPKAGSPLP